jgi:hypothetical protein
MPSTEVRCELLRIHLLGTWVNKPKIDKLRAARALVSVHTWLRQTSMRKEAGLISPRLEGGCAYEAHSVGCCGSCSVRADVCGPRLGGPAVCEPEPGPIKEICTKSNVSKSGNGHTKETVTFETGKERITTHTHFKFF